LSEALLPSTIEGGLFRAEDEGVEQELTERPRVSEHERVLDWRFDALEDAGFNPVAALVLAESGVDHHVAANLLASGCPHDTALRILL
jgi:hypothetical protein